MFQKILVPLDGSEIAEGILPYASQLAVTLDAPLVLLTVIDPDDVPEPQRRAWSERFTSFPESYRYAPTEGTDPAAAVPKTPSSTLVHGTGGPYASQMLEKVEQAVRGRLQAVAERLTQVGARAQCLAAFGAPAEQIVAVARREGCDLIAMSTHGRSALGRGILGSVTDRVIHSSNLPTLTITPRRAEQYRRDGFTISKIMVPLDGSPLAETALPYVTELARNLGLEVVLVRVIGTGAAYWGHVGGYPYAGSVDVEKEAELESLDYLKGMARRLEAEGLKVQCQVRSGFPAPTIVELARNMPQDIIVMATHGRSGLSRWVLGSVAEAVIRASGDPVLVIPPASTAGPTTR